MGVGFINSEDGFEAVRNAMANILASESANQYALAEQWNIDNPSDTVDPDDWVLDIYVERNNPFELFRDDSLVVAHSGRHSGCVDSCGALCGKEV